MFYFFLFVIPINSYEVNGFFHHRDANSAREVCLHK